MKGQSDASGAMAVACEYRLDSGNCSSMGMTVISFVDERGVVVDGDHIMAFCNGAD